MRVLLLLVALPLAWAQFPAVCNTQESIDSKTCCPNNCNSRGICKDISKKVMDTWPSSNPIVSIVCDNMMPQDVRCQWPIRVFNKVCSCNETWGGYDCSQCDFGYINVGGDCVKNTNQLLMRKNFKTLTMQQQEEYISVLKASKNEDEQDMEWAVVVGEPNDTSNLFTLQNVSTYDMFVLHHFLAAREKDNNMCKRKIFCPNGVEIDFAHEGPTFLTWHRYYLLIVERELRRVAERIGVSNFNLVYWDWTPQDTSLFSNELFGTPEYSDTPVDVTGSLFDTWPVLYDEHYRAYLAEKGLGGNKPTCDVVRALRNVKEDRKENYHLERGKICDENQFLPNDGSIRMALTATSYVDDDDDGFRDRLEGFRELCAGENPVCISGGGNNNLHNAVHIYLSGHMRDVSTASNDPIFFLHHANIDRIFEAWLRKLNDNQLVYEPSSAEHPGHNRGDYLVPFFPLKTNADMYKISSELGFSYDSLPSDMNSIAPGQCPASGTCRKGGYTPPNSQPRACPQRAMCPQNGGGGGTSSPSGGGGTSSPSGGGGTSSPDAGSSDFHVPFHLILIAGASVLMALKLSGM